MSPGVFVWLFLFLCAVILPNGVSAASDNVVATKTDNIDKSYVVRNITLPTGVVDKNLELPTSSLLTASIKNLQAISHNVSVDVTNTPALPVVDAEADVQPVTQLPIITEPVIDLPILNDPIVAQSSVQPVETPTPESVGVTPLEIDIPPILEPLPVILEPTAPTVVPREEVIPGRGASSQNESQIGSVLSNQIASTTPQQVVADVTQENQQEPLLTAIQSAPVQAPLKNVTPVSVSTPEIVPLAQVSTNKVVSIYPAIQSLSIYGVSGLAVLLLGVLMLFAPFISRRYDNQLR